MYSLLDHPIIAREAGFLLAALYDTVLWQASE
jgi:hypothetical protein